MESTTSGAAHKGEIYAVIEQPYNVVTPALARPAHWCDILTLQVNVKRCNASDDGGGETLAAFITRKPRDPLDSAYRVDFRYDLATASADYLHVALSSHSGPVGTRDYAIRLEAAPLDSRGVVERSAMRYYLAVDAYVESLAAHPGQRLEARLRRWYAATERYPQLREAVGPGEYLEMKRKQASAALAG